MSKTQKLRPCQIPDLIRHLFLAWLCSALLEYLFLPEALQDISNKTGIAAMSMPRLLIMTGLFTVILLLVSLWKSIATAERWSIAGVFMLLSVAALVNTFSWELLGFCCLIFVILVIYAIWGRQSAQDLPEKAEKAHWSLVLILAALAAAVFLFLSVWTVCRVLTLSAPCFDFGIFSQMFYYMKETGLPLTTVEREVGLLSHFAVHVSPVYYLMLPFYWLVPTPATLQVLQAAVVVSAVIPMWLIGKQRGLSGLQRTLLCGVLLFAPAVCGGVSYDLHENCFLLPFVLWLMYAIDKRSIPLSVLFAALTLSVKEDAAVYVAVAALYLIVRTAVDFEKQKWKELLLGSVLFALALIWFFLVTNYLANQGDGVMTYRYNNFIYDGSDSLFTVVKAIILCPMKLLYECTHSDRLPYIAHTLLPLLALPLITRKYPRYLLLIPFLLVNLMPNWKYQYDIFFQYSFGSYGFLLYLAALNLADIPWKKMRFIATAAALIVSLSCFLSLIVPKANTYISLYAENKNYYSSISEVLDTIPDDASVTAHTFYITPLSQRELLYDIRYCTKENMLSSEYIVLKTSATADFKNALLGVKSFAELDTMLKENGYTEQAKQGSLVIYYKSAT